MTLEDLTQMSAEDLHQRMKAAGLAADRWHELRLYSERCATEAALNVRPDPRRPVASFEQAVAEVAEHLRTAATAREAMSLCSREYDLVKSVLHFRELSDG